MLRVESYKKGIVLSTAFNVFNKGAVFLNGLLVAYFFGVTRSTDFFFYVYNTVGLLGAFFTSMNSTVVIPESMRIRTQEGKDPAMQFLNFFLFLYSAVMITGLAFVLLNPVSFIAAISSFNSSQLMDNRMLIFLSLPLFALVCLNNLLIDILASYKFFTISMIVGLINGLSSICFILAFHGSMGIQSVFCGLVLAYFVNFALLLFLMRRYLHWNFAFKKPKISKRIWKNLWFAQLGNFASTLSSYAPIYLLSGFSAGVITALSFAQQISALPATLIIYQFSAVVGIKFNELYNEKDYVEINRIFLNTANFLIFIVLPISGICFMFSDQIITVLLKRGKFNQEGIAHASLFLKYLGLLLPFTVINTLFARLFMASHKIREAFWYQFTLNVILIVVIYLAIRNIGIVGYPVSLLTIYLANTVFCYFLERRYFGIINYVQVLKNFGLFALINIAVALTVYLVTMWLPSNYGLLTLLLGSTLYIASLAAIGVKFRLNETVNLFVKKILQMARLQ